MISNASLMVSMSQVTKKAAGDKQAKLVESRRTLVNGE